MPVSSTVTAGQDALDSQYNNLRYDTSPAGAIMPFGGKTIPTSWGWLMCYGQAVSRATYADLFAVIAPSLGTFTVTIASPAVFTLTAHGLVAGDAVYFTTTGALPTGLTANTLYYVISAGLTSDNFQVSATRGGAAVNTSGTQSGTHTARACPFGLGDGSTTFNVPDMRGNVPLGKDNMGGSSRNRVTDANADAVGAEDGEEDHTLTAAEMAHTHSITFSGHGFVIDNGANSPRVTDGTYNTDGVTIGAPTGHNNMQPYITMNYIIKY